MIVMITWLTIVAICFFVVCIMIKRAVDFVIEKLDAAEDKKLKEVEQEYIPNNDAYFQYKYLESKLKDIQIDTKEMDDMLDGMDKLWYKLTDEERDELNKEERFADKFANERVVVVELKEEEVIPFFTCVVCEIKHPSPGKDPKNNVWLFPKDTATTQKDYDGKYSICCIGCERK